MKIRNLIKIQTWAVAGLMIVGLAACEHPATQESAQDREQKSDERMRQAGRSAYNAAQKAQDAAEELKRQVERAGKEAREGWDEAKRDREVKKP